MWKKLASVGLVASVAMSLVACGAGPMSYSSLESQLEQPTAIVDMVTVSRAFDQFKASTELSANINPVETTSPRPDAPPSSVPMPLTAKSASKMSMFAMMKKTGVPAQAIQTLRADVLQAAKPTLKLQGIKVLPNQVGTTTKNTKFLSCIEGDSIFNKDAKYTIDMSCAGAGTGLIHVETRNFDFMAMSNSDEQPPQIDGEVRIHFDSTCTEGVCTDGHLAIKLQLDANAKTLYFLSSYDMTISDGTKTLNPKGGMRIKSSEAGGTSAEMLVVVKNSEGQEGSIVIGMRANENDGSIYLKGKNGTFACSSKDNGKTGVCIATDDKNNKVIWAASTN